MDSDFQQKQYQHHFQGLQKEFHNQKQQLHSLTRFRSAPTSYFASFLDAADAVTTSAGGAGGAGGGDGGYKGDFSNSRPLSPETENIFARFMSSMGDGNNSSANKLSDIPENSQMQTESMARVKQEDDILPPNQQNNFTTAPQMMYQSASKPPLANHHNLGSAEAKVGINSTPHMKTGIGGSNGFSLARHSSSPAGFFADFNIDGYDVTRGMGNYGGNDQMNYSSSQPTSTSGIARQNSDVQGTLMRMNSLEETKFSINQNKDSNFTTGIPMSSWEDSILSETFPSLDGGDDDGRIFSEHNSSKNQIGEKRSRPRPLAHHLSLPNTSSELSSMDNLLHLQDGVLLRSRAKRGCATHPRSIAERVRRTKISERMRKLQDLVPNMDKQTNTSDMLDLAVDYIKDLQMKVKHLHCIREKCTCPR